jgi:ElaB/YqjD/DUF883 family membrane-anchored ribosome-binding protein
MAQGTQYSTDNGTAKSELRDKAAEGFDRVTDTVESIAKTAVERGREIGKDVEAVAGNMKSAVDTSVKDQPMATLAVAAVLGFVLGAIWKS